MTVHYKNIQALSQRRLAMNKSFFAVPACVDGGGVWNLLLKRLLLKILKNARWRNANTQGSLKDLRK